MACGAVSTGEVRGRYLTEVDVLLSTRVSATDYPNVIE
jgi:hypothetical protein